MHLRSALLLASTAWALLPMTASAQGTGTAASTDENAGGDIIVTAQHRKQTLEKTPLTITALTGDVLAAQGVVTVANLQSQVPAVQIAPQVFGNLQIFIRGIGSTSNMEGGDPAVAVNVDGVYVSRTTSIAGLLYDLERVEVVKGPQGTLYGRNATGGSVNIITQKPTFDKVKGYASAQLGNYANIETEGAINLPLSNTLAARIAFKTASHDGYLKAQDGPNGTVGNDRQDQDAQAVRAQLLWEPTDKLSVLLSGDYSKMGGAGGGETLLPSVTGDPYVMRARQDLTQNNEFANGTLTANYDLGFATLTYIGAYRYSKVDKKYEYPLSNYPGFIYSKNDEITNELRLGGETGRLSWVGGIYQFYEKTEGDLRLQITPTLWQHVVTPYAKAWSKAAFGQLTYELMDGLRLTGGLRYTEDKKRQLGSTLIEQQSGTLISTSSTQDSRGKWNKLNWKAGVEYDVAPGSMFYGTVSTAYKSGGNYSGSAPNTYAPENLTAYEIGLKNRLFGNAVTLNLAAYWYDYKDLQVTSLDSDNGLTRTVTRNAGDATIKGFDVDGSWNTGSFGKFDGSLSYIDARYDTFILPFGDSYTNFGTGTVAPADFSGERMPFAPKWTFNVGYEYGLPFLSGELTGRAQTHYESAKKLDFHGFDVHRQGSFTKTDLMLTYQPDAASWSVQAFVRNIENKAVLATAIPPVAASPIYAQAAYAPPRTYGVMARVTF